MRYTNIPINYQDYKNAQKTAKLLTHISFYEIFTQLIQAQAIQDQHKNIRKLIEFACQTKITHYICIYRFRQQQCSLIFTLLSD